MVLFIELSLRNHAVMLDWDQRIPVSKVQIHAFFFIQSRKPFFHKRNQQTTHTSKFSDALVQICRK